MKRNARGYVYGIGVNFELRTLRKWNLANCTPRLKANVFMLAPPVNSIEAMQGPPWFSSMVSSCLAVITIARAELRTVPHAGHSTNYSQADDTAVMIREFVEEYNSDERAQGQAA